MLFAEAVCKPFEEPGTPCPSGADQRSVSRVPSFDHM
jgi:hypothetical protein